MEVETSTENGNTEPNRRRSGRVIRRPAHLEDEINDGSILSNGSVKRKRTLVSKQVNGNDGLTSESESDDDESEGEPDEEEIREKRRVPQKRAPISKPAAKRAKTTKADATTLVMRPATTKAAQVQKARSRPSQAHRQGLFAQVFGHGNTADKAASIWISSLRKDSVAAIRDLINFVLECIGCEIRIESHDVEDIDNVPNRLGDVLEEYAQDKTAEYPLISKAKSFAEFRAILTSFFVELIKALHNSSIFYNQPEVYDNIHIWIATMSGANYRPFRHTATVVSLAMTTALCEVAKDIQTHLSTQKSQLETSKKQRNKGRVSDIQKDIKSDEEKLESIEAQLRDAFDTVYVHRYRDVDEKIRVECVSALGRWIDLHRSMFLEGQYLRYLGWVMSDVNAPTRLEVIKQLDFLFKDKRNVAALRAFTDRFRSRMVEMGARDADVNVRVSSIELLDKLRNYELLEPDDIDTIGRLIFDIEPRVRKAVAKFFVSNITDLYKASIDDMDREQFETALPEDEDDFMSPIQSWIKFKCLTQTLGSYEKDSESADGNENAGGLFRGGENESRYMLATDSIFPYMSELRNWESLAGFLLYDHSSITSDAEDADIDLAVQAAYKLKSGEEAILLDVLLYSVKLYLQTIAEPQQEKKGRKVRLTEAEIREKQETAAQNLANIIPQLLSRHGSTPKATASILRLEHLLNADLIGDVQTGDTAVTALLDNIHKQFTTHSDPKVLAEASKALRAARSFEHSKEAADAKVQEIWTDASATLHNLLKNKNIDTRGTIDRKTLGELVSVTVKLAHLASVSDCTEQLEANMVSKKQKGKAGIPPTLLLLLLELVKRGIPDEDTTPEFAEKEDQVCIAATNILSLYFRWKIVGLKTAITSNDSRHLTTPLLVDLAIQRSSFIEALSPVIEARSALDQVRINAIIITLDLFTLFATVRYMRPEKGTLDDEVKINLASLLTNVPENLLHDIMMTHEKMEKSLAKKSNRKIEATTHSKKSKEIIVEESQEDIEKPPEDSDDEADDNSDSDADENDGGEDGVETSAGAGGRNARKQASLLAEQQLCELTSKLVLGIIAGVIDAKVKQRLQINRSKLGKSYGQVIAYLDEKKEKGANNKKKDARPGTAGSGNAATPRPKSAAGLATGQQQQQREQQASAKKTAAATSMEVEADPIEDDEEAEDDEDAGENGENEDEQEQEEQEGDDDDDENADVEKPAEDDDDDEVLGD